MLVVNEKKKREDCCFEFLGAYLRLLNKIAADITAIMTTATAIAMYSVVGGASLLGGGATVGEAVIEGEGDDV